MQTLQNVDACVINFPLWTNKTGIYYKLHVLLPERLQLIKGATLIFCNRSIIIFLILTQNCFSHVSWTTLWRMMPSSASIINLVEKSRQTILRRYLHFFNWLRTYYTIVLSNYASFLHVRHVRQIEAINIFQIKLGLRMLKNEILVLENNSTR